MSGIPYIHSDAGGFAMGEGDAELYLRWLQFSEYTPIFRPHGTALYEVDPNAFSYPSEPALADKSVISNVRAVVNDRYDMLPYNYTLAYRQAAFGEPLIRPLYYQFPADAKASSIGDEFMWGDALLVAPVLEKGQKFRTIYLPKGEWYDFQKNTPFKGDTTISAELTLKNIPVFVKAGSFITNYSFTPKNTSTIPIRGIMVHYYPAATASSYQLYLDDGVSKNSIEKKAFELINFTSSGFNGKELAIKIESNNGVYQGKPENYLFSLNLMNIQDRPKKIMVNTVEREIQSSNKGIEMTKVNQASWNFENMHEIMLNVKYTGEPINILINW
jgi:oligosaccharide 4-alpha-D-glucosyltransferase